MSSTNWAAVWLTLFVITMTVAVPAAADEEGSKTYVEIKELRWRDKGGRLTIKAEGRVAPSHGKRVTVEIRSGGELIATRKVRREDDYRWEIETRVEELGTVPCKVSLVAGGVENQREVAGAPQNCDSGGMGGDTGGGTGGDTNGGTGGDTSGGTGGDTSGGTGGDTNGGTGGDTSRNGDVSINSTAQGCGQGNTNGVGSIDCQAMAVAEPAAPNADNSNNPAAGTGDAGHQIVAINDLGMHCGDLDTRISSILPPFQVLLAQVIEKGNEPKLLGPDMVEVFYAAASNPNDPILTRADAFTGLTANGDTYKTNFWDDPIPGGAYDAFYPAFNPFDATQTITPLAGPPFNVTAGRGLPVPNVEDLYIGPDGLVNSKDEFLSAVQQNMPGVNGPHAANDAQLVHEYLEDKPFFVNFPFGYVANDVDWFEGAGIPFAAYDDFGRENAYPLVSVQARTHGGTPLATVQTVLPISGEASCKNCHAAPDEFTDSRTSEPTDTLKGAGLPVASQMDDPESNTLPVDVSVEYATDINVLRLHDLKHGAGYVGTDNSPDPCDINANDGNGDTSCLTNQALVQNKPVVCQVCHYTPALDLAQLGPLAGEPGTIANGRNQVAHKSNSNVMHSHHGQFTDLFPDMPAPIQAADGSITNQPERIQVMEQTCYQCHPGEKVQCLRGAMFNADMLCNDCHGDMKQVGADFSAEVSPDQPGNFKLGQGNFYEPGSGQPRVPWANEPGCGSCHTGDALDNALTLNDDGVNPEQVIVNNVDTAGNTDGIRLRRAYRNDDPKATPIVPVNTRFAENSIPDGFNGFSNPGAGTVGDTAARNPKLYRVSTGHGGVFCEGCHGATHAEWPNSNPFANDNVTSDQLQGHTGSIGECAACHTGTLGLTLDGPHGMHPVGERRWNNSHKELQKEQGAAVCKACHGPDGKGTVLSRTFNDRTFECKERGTLCRNSDDRITVARGTPIGCVECHKNYINGDD